VSDPIQEQLLIGPFPRNDGWQWLYRLFNRLVRNHPVVRRTVCKFFWPTPAERSIYRILGVDHFGRFVPTGGIGIRRLTGSRMAPYTLKARNLKAAREFFYRTCVFEALHVPFHLALLGLSVLRLVAGRPDLALENFGVNMLFNVYPIMHHRNTRYRIVELLKRKARRTRNLEQPVGLETKVK
jgi:glycosyl-4,4'-diaponeurosporenoate acyltransferase